MGMPGASSERLGLVTVQMPDSFRKEELHKLAQPKRSFMDRLLGRQQ